MRWTMSHYGLNKGFFSLPFAKNSKLRIYTRRATYRTVLGLGFWVCLEAQFNKGWVFRYSVKCIQEVTENDSFSFKTLFIVLYPTQDRYYSCGLHKIKTQTIFSTSSHSSCGKEVDR